MSVSQSRWWSVIQAPAAEPPRAMLRASQGITRWSRTRRPHRAGRLLVPGALASGHDGFHPSSPGLLVAGERRRDVRLVAHALGEDDGVLDRHRGALPGGRGDRVGGVAEDHHPVPVPRRDPREVVGVPPREDLAGRAQERVEGQLVVGEQLAQPCAPPVLTDRLQGCAAELGAARGVGEPPDVPVGSEEPAQEASPSEAEVGHADRSVEEVGVRPARAPAGVEQTRVAGPRGSRVDGGADPGAEAVGTHQQVPGGRLAGGAAHLDAVRPAPRVDDPASVDDLGPPSRPRRAARGRGRHDAASAPAARPVAERRRGRPRGGVPGGRAGPSRVSRTPGRRRRR